MPSTPKPTRRDAKLRAEVRDDPMFRSDLPPEPKLAPRPVRRPATPAQAVEPHAEADEAHAVLNKAFATTVAEMSPKALGRLMQRSVFSAVISAGIVLTVLGALLISML